MNDEFISWDDLDLDSLLGEYTDDDGEFCELSESENDDAGKEKENESPAKRKKINNKHLYVCPICPKEYRSASGFRGHVTKKHDKPELRAHMHQKLDTESEKIHLPDKKIPLASSDELQKEMPHLLNSSLTDIQTDKIHGLPSSFSGRHMIAIATALLMARVSRVQAIFLEHLTPLVSSGAHEHYASQFFRGINKLRFNVTFVSTMKAAISDILPEEIPGRFVKPFIQNLLMQFTTSYFKRQNELMQNEESVDADSLTLNDKQVLYYICGYMIHALRKKYYRLKKGNSQHLLSCLDHLISSDTSTNVPSSWTDTLDRGGLKKPHAKFFTLFVQVESWVRNVVAIKRLNSDSLVNLKSTLLDYRMLKVSWEKILVGDLSLKWTVLEHILSLFLKVRGFAVTKLIRKTLQLQQKNKVKAGSARKALRKELKAMNELKK